MIEIYKNHYKEARDKYQKDRDPVTLSEMNASRLAILQCCIGKYVKFKSIGSTHIAYVVNIDGNKCDAVFPYYGGQKIADVLSIEIISEEEFKNNLKPVDVDGVMKFIEAFKK